MSIVTIQLGQCGNQVGGQLFNTLSQEAVIAGTSETKSSSSTANIESLIFERFFRAPTPATTGSSKGSGGSSDTPSSATDGSNMAPYARAVMVDMEPKALQQTANAAKRSGRFQYDSKRQYWKQSGSANNWAFGYAQHGPKSRDKVIELVRKEIEACDSLSGLFILQSLAGGTGSGVGTYFTEQFRDEFNSFMLNPVIWPYENGEVIVQNYNSVLSLSHLIEVLHAHYARVVGRCNDDTMMDGAMIGIRWIGGDRE
jgi:tubulin delta